MKETVVNTNNEENTIIVETIVIANKKALRKKFIKGVFVGLAVAAVAIVAKDSDIMSVVSDILKNNTDDTPATTE